MQKYSVTLLCGTALTLASLMPASAQQEVAAGLETVVVTAQRRTENLQQVPISVAAVTAESLARSGVSSTKDLPQLVPAVQFTRAGNSGLFYIRGVGTTSASIGEEGANAIYVDGVYLVGLDQTINEFNNIERVEVLKGPQGTLFGRNATGGLLHIITREPGTEMVAQGQIGYAKYSKITGQVYVGGPLSDKVSADISFTGGDQQDGWGRNLTVNKKNNTQEYWGVRSKVVYRATDSLKFIAAGDFSKNKDDLAQGYRLTNDPRYPATGGLLGPSRYDTTQDTPSSNDVKTWGVSLTAEADLGFANLTSITAMRNARNDVIVDVDTGPLNLVNLQFVGNTRSVQQELRLASNDPGPLSWQFGLFYLRSDAKLRQAQYGGAFAALGLRVNLIQAAQDTNSYAAFGELTYAITPTTKLTGGVRFTKDDRFYDGGQTPTLLSGVTLARTRNPLTHASYSEPSFRAAIHQDITDSVNAYFTFNRSFKSGTFVPQSPLIAPVKPQFINAYEVGVKSELFDRMLRFNVSAYHYDITDLQVRSSALGGPGAGVLLNAATVKVDGVDVELEAAPTEELRINGGFTVLNARYAKFGGGGPTSTLLQGPVSYPSPATCPVNLRGTRDPGLLGAGPRTGGITTCLGDVSGNRVPLSPKFVGNLGASYTTPVGNEGEVRLSLLYTYNSGYKFESDNLFGQKKFDLLSGSIEYRPSPHYAIEVWGNNLTKSYYIVANQVTGTGVSVTSGAPQTYGVNLKFNW